MKHVACSSGAGLGAAHTALPTGPRALAVTNMNEHDMSVDLSGSARGSAQQPDPAAHMVQNAQHVAAVPSDVQLVPANTWLSQLPEVSSAPHDGGTTGMPITHLTHGALAPSQQLHLAYPTVHLPVNAHHMAAMPVDMQVMHAHTWTAQLPAVSADLQDCGAIGLPITTHPHDPPMTSWQLHQANPAVQYLYNAHHVAALIASMQAMPANPWLAELANVNSDPNGWGATELPTNQPCGALTNAQQLCPNLQDSQHIADVPAGMQLMPAHSWGAQVPNASASSHASGLLPTGQPYGPLSNNQQVSHAHLAVHQYQTAQPLIAVPTGMQLGPATTWTTQLPHSNAAQHELSATLPLLMNQPHGQLSAATPGWFHTGLACQPGGDDLAPVALQGSTVGTLATANVTSHLQCLPYSTTTAQQGSATGPAALGQVPSRNPLIHAAPAAAMPHTPGMWPSNMTAGFMSVAPGPVSGYVMLGNSTRTSPNEYGAGSGQAHHTHMRPSHGLQCNTEWLRGVAYGLEHDLDSKGNAGGGEQLNMHTAATTSQEPQRCCPDKALHSRVHINSKLCAIATKPAGPKQDFWEDACSSGTDSSETDCSEHDMPDIIHARCRKWASSLGCKQWAPSALRGDGKPYMDIPLRSYQAHVLKEEVARRLAEAAEAAAAAAASTVAVRLSGCTTPTLAQASISRRGAVPLEDVPCSWLQLLVSHLPSAGKLSLFQTCWTLAKQVMHGTASVTLKLLSIPGPGTDTARRRSIITRLLSVSHNRTFALEVCPCLAQPVPRTLCSRITSLTFGPLCCCLRGTPYINMYLCGWFDWPSMPRLTTIHSSRPELIVTMGADDRALCDAVEAGHLPHLVHLTAPIFLYDTQVERRMLQKLGPQLQSVSLLIAPKRALIPRLQYCPSITSVHLSWFAEPCVLHSSVIQHLCDHPTVRTVQISNITSSNLYIHGDHSRRKCNWEKLILFGRSLNLQQVCKLPLAGLRELRLQSSAYDVDESSDLEEEEEEELEEVVAKLSRYAPKIVCGPADMDDSRFFTLGLPNPCAPLLLGVMRGVHGVLFHGDVSAMPSLYSALPESVHTICIDPDNSFLSVWQQLWQGLPQHVTRVVLMPDCRLDGVDFCTLVRTAPAHLGVLDIVDPDPVDQVPMGVKESAPAHLRVNVHKKTSHLSLRINTHLA